MLRTIRRILAGAEIVLFGLILALFAAGLIHNIKLKKGFVSSAEFDYLEALKDGSLQEKMKPYQTNVQAMTGADAHKNVITVPRDLVYSYEDEQYIIHRGEMINVYYDEDNGYLSLYGYGFQSYPTEKRGMRAVMPFKLAAETEVRQELYHIDISGLKRTYAAYYHENISGYSKSGQWLDLRLRNARRETALYWSDKLLYTEGIYLSKDLYWPLFNVPLVIATGVLGLILWGLRFSRRRPDPDKIYNLITFR